MSEKGHITDGTEVEVCFHRGILQPAEPLRGLLIKGELRIFTSLNGKEGTLTSLRESLEYVFASSIEDEVILVCKITDFHREANIPSKTTITVVTWRRPLTAEQAMRATRVFPAVVDQNLCDSVEVDLSDLG